MSLFGLMLLLVGLIFVFIIGYGLFLMKPYPEPIVTEGKIIEKYVLPEEKYYTISSQGGLTSMPMSVTEQRTYIVILSEKGHKTKIQVGIEKYNSLEIDDPVEIIEYSRTKMIVEKKRNPHSRNETRT